MAVTYSVAQRVNPSDPNAPRKYYGVAQTSGNVTLRQLSNQIADISTVSSIDTLAVLESLIKVLPEHLLDGKIVRLGDFGSFRLTISSAGADSADDFNQSMIKKVNLKFRPGKLISNALKSVSFEKV